MGEGGGWIQIYSGRVLFETYLLSLERYYSGITKTTSLASLV
jgi:hypothetical protein